MIPKAVLMRSGLISLTTARPVNTAQPRITVNSARPMINVFNKAHSTVRRSIDVLSLYGLEVDWIRRIQELDKAYWAFLGVGTTLDIFQNIILIPYLEYGVLSPLDTAY
ncbi:hypothetical protein Tco_1409115 [Tanacetum coccineum]